MDSRPENPRASDSGTCLGRQPGACTKQDAQGRLTSPNGPGWGGGRSESGRVAHLEHSVASESVCEVLRCGNVLILKGKKNQDLKLYIDDVVSAI